MTIRIHPTADVSPNATLGEGTSVWHQAQIRENASIGKYCIISKGVYVDSEVKIGNNVKIQNYVSIYHGVTLEDGVFVGPHVCFTNDLRPRAVNPDGTLKAADDWTKTPTLVRFGAALGANSTIRCGVTIGKWAMVGIGSVVTRDIPDYALAWGNPSRIRGFVCPCGEKLEKSGERGEFILAECPKCKRTIEIRSQLWELSHD